VFWQCEIRIDLMTKPLLAKMREAGLFYVSFGVEAGSERVRDTVINKRIKLQDFQNVVAWSKDLGIVPNAFFIFSHPTETWEEAQETIRLIEQYKSEVEATVAILHVYPGTPLEVTAKEIGLLPADFTWTKRHSSKVITLPTAQGDVPLFLDKLTWAQISELLFRWSFSRRDIPIARKIPRVLSKIRSWGDIKRYTIMAFVLLKLRLKKLMGKGG
jgi:anaerobic magnesium-protoporphyrin IX monomethyl ester cyclase